MMMFGYDGSNLFWQYFCKIDKNNYNANGLYIRIILNKNDNNYNKSNLSKDNMMIINWQ